MSVFIDSHTHHTSFIYPKEPVEIKELASIIIGNYNHTKETLSLIRRLGDYQKEKIDIEIIVADTGSNKEQIEQLISGLDRMSVVNCPIKLVQVDKSELRKTSPHIHAFSFGINAGVKVSSGDIIVSCDSSIITPENFIYEMCVPHLDGKKVFVRAPLYDIKEENIGIIDADDFREQNYATIMSWIDKKMLKHSMGRPAWSVRRKDFIDMGGFDEEMIYYGIADDDFCTRMLINGAENTMSKSRVIHLWHPEPRNTNQNFNLSLMIKHIQENKVLVNENKTWGLYEQLIEFF